MTTSAHLAKSTLEDRVGRWHAGEGAGQELHDFLGMTAKAYAEWVETGDFPEPQETDEGRPGC